jgi:DNA helicase-2/ATP-dependent DNA helicase PcrA
LPEANVVVTEQKGGFGGYGANYGGSRFDTMQSFGSNYTTPGWQRAQARKTRGFEENTDDFIAQDEDFATPPPPPKSKEKRRIPLVIEGELVAKSTGTSVFTAGDRVFHQKFGNGNVTHIDGNKLTIQFDKAGEKRVVDSFVERV